MIASARSLLKSPRLRIRERPVRTPFTAGAPGTIHLIYPPADKNSNF
jgi:hypothetical protein